MRYKLKPLAEQTIVVTGASSGIGLEVATRAVERGAQVLLVARNKASLVRIAARLRRRGVRVALCAIDVAEPAAAETIADTAVREFGGFDTWVNDAAVTVYGTLDQISEEEHRRVLEVNYFAALNGSIAALRHLRHRGGGAIINVGSILSDRALILQIPYSAAKHALRAMTTGLRMDVDRERLAVSVTLIKPGAMHTPFPEHARNHMELPPRLPQIVYDPALAAEAVLFAAEHPRRQIYVGGYGFLLSVLARLFPRTTDRLMELFFVRAQQTAVRSDDLRRRDNLFEPREDGDVEGHQPVHVRRRSLFLEAQKHPAAAVGLGAGIGLALAATARTLARRANHVAE